MNYFLASPSARGKFDRAEDVEARLSQNCRVLKSVGLISRAPMAVVFFTSGGSPQEESTGGAAVILLKGHR